MYQIETFKQIGVTRVLSELAGCEWRREGSWMVARCPYHNDTNASFKVGGGRPDRGRCFSCGVDGDVVELAQRFLNLSLRETLERLGEVFNVQEGDAGDRTPRAARAPSERRPAVDPQLEAGLAAVWRMTTPVAESVTGSRYLDGRGLSTANLDHVAVVEEPRDWWETISKSLGHDATASLGLKGLYTWVRRRLPFLLFACVTSDGETAGFHARHIAPAPGDDTPRWLFAGPTSPWPFVVIPKSPKSPHLVVMSEGATDALAWSAAGHVAAGIPGVSGLRPWMAAELRRHFKEAAIALDADKAGRAAAPAWAETVSSAGFKEPHQVDMLLEGTACTDAGDYAREGHLDLLSVKLLAARIESLPEQQVQAVAAALGVPAEDSAPPVPAEQPPPASATPAAHEAEDGPEGGKGLPPDSLDAVRARLKSVRLRWAIVLVEQWWGENHKGAVDPKLLAQFAIEWLEANGARFIRDAANEPWVYWRRSLQHVGAKNRAWLGVMWREGQVNRETRDGRVILEAIQAHAWAQTNTPRIEPWSVYDRERHELAIHTHDEQDRIVLVTGRGIRVETNAAGPLLLRTDSATKPIDCEARVSVKDAVGLLAKHMVENLATEHPQRALFTAWCLTAFLRQRLNTRALLFAQGPAGSGKSQAAKMATCLIFGEERLIDPTPAACRTEGALQPMVVLDNKEGRNMDAALTQFLLLSATGIVRKKRAEGTTDGVHDESINALVLITAIEPPGLPELAARTMTVTFSRDLQREGYQPMAALRGLVKSRGAILMGLLGMVVNILSGAPKDEIRALLDAVPPRHARARLGEHLVLMAWLAGEMRRHCPDIWGPSRPTARELLDCWLEDERHLAQDQALGTDPIYAALQALLWSWNRVVVRHGEMVRPSLDDNLFRCRPLYVAQAGRLVPQAAAARLTIEGHRDFKAVGGFVGSYTDLHADLVRAARDGGGAAAYGDAIKSASVLAARLKGNLAFEHGGWHAELLKASATGRTYKFWLDPHLIQGAAMDLAIETASEARTEAHADGGDAAQTAAPF